MNRTGRIRLTQVLPHAALAALAATALAASLLLAGPGAPLARSPRSELLRAAPAAVQVSTGTSATRAYKARVLGLVNAQRARHHLPALTLSSCPDRYATRWSTHLAATGTLSHQSLWTILRACPARAAGENVGWTTGSADAMVRMWMASPGHRANILNPRYHRLGLGVARTSTGRWYATQDFLS